MVKIETNISLAKHTTFMLGGLASYFCYANSLEDLKYAIKWAKNEFPGNKSHGLPAVNGILPILIIGGGSNLLISDKGYNGLVIKYQAKGIHFTYIAGKAFVTVSAGESLDHFVATTCEKNYFGLECLSGIPGLVGGAIAQNAGAYDREIKDILVNLKSLNIHALKVTERSGEKCNFKYRKSVFKHNNTEIIVEAKFKLSKAPVGEFREDIVEKLSSKTITPISIRDAVISLRKSKSMIWDISDPNSISSGSFFINPVISNTFFNKLKQKYPDIVYRSETKHTKKLSAGWLIEKSGFAKGYIFKSTGLSKKHALVIINRGNSLSEDIYEFAKLIKTRVHRKFNIVLKIEPILLEF